MHAVLESVARRISREAAGMSARAVETHPGGQPEHQPEKWSSRQIIEHLALTYRATTQTLEERLAKGRVSRNQKRTMLQWVLQWMVLGFGYLPAGMPALEETVPAAGGDRKMDGEDLSNLLTRELRAMDTALLACRRRFGMERVAPHPILGPLRVDQWLRYHSVHGRRHLKQLAAIRRETAASEAALRRPRNLRLAKELQIPAQRSLT